jgi:Sec-independent protein translocase protein TatA
MDIFGIGGPEFILLLALGGIVLGPRRIVLAYREIGKFLKQVQGLTRGITQELNNEIDQLNHEIKYGKTAPDEDSAGGNENGAHPANELPEAYKQFREDFPEEGALDTPRETTEEDKPENP